MDYNVQAAILLLHVLTTILTLYYDFYLNSVFKSEINHKSDILFISVAVSRLSKLIFPASVKPVFGSLASRFLFLLNII